MNSLLLTDGYKTSHEKMYPENSTWETVNSEENLLKIRYKDGKFFNTTTLTDIKNKLNGKN